jgi:hypothetical protein
MANEQACYTVVQDDGSEVPSNQELRSALEKGSDELKIETLRKIIITTLNGNDQVKYTSASGHSSLHVQLTLVLLVKYRNLHILIVLVV